MTCYIIDENEIHHSYDILNRSQLNYKDINFSNSLETKSLLKLKNI